MKVKASKVLTERFRFSGDELRRFIATCPFRYKIYQIPKRNSLETRTIAHPSRVLKAVQRTLLSEILNDMLIVHDSAKAYKEGTSIKDNAAPHLHNKYLLKMDFRKFFPSITALDFELFLREKYKISDPRELTILKRVFFMEQNERYILSIGSPGSPLISNAMLYDFDKKMTKLSQKAGVNYTRYSDDLSFSTRKEHVLADWPELVEQVLSELPYPRLSINTKKTVHSSTKHNRHITGITLSSEGKLSLGREKKRKIRSLVYRAGTLKPKELEKLRGHLAFLAHIEPETYARLREKYADEFGLIGSNFDQS